MRYLHLNLALQVPCVTFTLNLALQVRAVARCECMAWARRRQQQSCGSTGIHTLREGTWHSYSESGHLAFVLCTWHSYPEPLAPWQHIHPLSPTAIATTVYPSYSQARPPPVLHVYACTSTCTSKATPGRTAKLASTSTPSPPEPSAA